MDRSPFHAGEQRLQRAAGVRERLEQVGRAAIRDHMPEQHRELFAELPTLLLAALDAEGRPWATMLHGEPGFVSSPDARTLHVQAWPDAEDPLAPLLRKGAPLGVLGLQPHTRRRNRMNGRLRAVEAGGFSIAVEQSFGNCPKYIHGRRPMTVQRRDAGPARRLGPELDDDARRLVRTADTLFIASASRAHPGEADGDGVDVSHRGGPAGFVQLSPGPQGLRLSLPDYPGNRFYNTLGNLSIWPLAGLLLMDPERGDLLHVSARATLALDGERPQLHLDVQQAWWRPAALPLRWSAPEAPPQFAA